METQEHEEETSFGYDAGVGRYIMTDADMEADEDERLDSQKAWEAGYEAGEEWALEEQTKEGAWDEN